MVNPDLLVDAVRDKLRAIPAVVTLVSSDATRITSYLDDEKGLPTAVYEMEEATIMVALLGNEAGEPGFQAWTWTLAIFFKVDARYGAVMTAVCNSVATGDSQKFTETEFHIDFEQLGVPVLVRDPDDDGIEHPRIDMRFRQRSQD